MQGAEIIIEAAALLQNHQNIHFLIVGDGVRRDQIAAQLDKLQLNTVQLLPQQPRELIPRFLNTADVCLAPLANKKVKGVIPYKMLEAWAYRRPVIITDENEGGKLAASCNAGLATPPGDARALADAILTLEADRTRARQMGENGRRCIEEKLNREKLARQMESVLLTVTQPSDIQSP
jgi:glycosyltransferase involved in cell wall biosynthesis